MVNVKLHGKLGEKFQKSWDLDVNDVAEVIRAIDSQKPGFREYIIEHDLQGGHYCAAIDGEKIVNEDGFFCRIPKKTKTIDFLPVPAGAAPALPFLVEVAKMVAVALIVGFVMNKMFAPPDPQELKDADSYLFSGPVNVQGQGIPVPIGYGTLLVGGKVVSAVNFSRDNPDIGMRRNGPTSWASHQEEQQRLFAKFAVDNFGFRWKQHGRYKTVKKAWNSHVAAMENLVNKAKEKTNKAQTSASAMDDVIVSRIFLRQNKEVKLGDYRNEDSNGG